MSSHQIASVSTRRLEPFIGEQRADALNLALRRLADGLQGRRLVNVTGDDRRKGGVFEILRSTLPYVRGAGVDVVWIDLATPLSSRPALEYFHVLAHGVAASDCWQDDLAHRSRELSEFASTASVDLRRTLRADDVLVLHDTQTAPLAGVLEDWSESTAWHAHIGTTDTNECVDAYWDVLGEALRRPRVRIAYRPEFVPPRWRGAFVAASPGLDPSTPKSALVGQRAARRRLEAGCGPLRWISSEPGLHLCPDDRVAVQLARWDPLKDMVGAVEIFGRLAERLPKFHGLVVGPAAQSDSEKQVLEQAVSMHRLLTPQVRARVHIGEVSDAGSAAHDIAVQTVQSSADVVIQRSRQEGFGLTVTEAMWRARAVVATDVGGIPLQVTPATGLLLAPDEPVERWTSEIHDLLLDDRRRLSLGTSARAAVKSQHLVDKYLGDAICGALTVASG